jgi:hypothetical protein
VKDVKTSCHKAVEALPASEPPAAVKLSAHYQLPTFAISSKSSTLYALSSSGNSDVILGKGLSPGARSRSFGMSPLAIQRGISQRAYRGTHPQNTPATPGVVAGSSSG